MDEEYDDIFSGAEAAFLEEDFETTLNRDDLNLNFTEYFDEDDYVKTNSTEADLNAKFEPVEPSKHNVSVKVNFIKNKLLEKRKSGIKATLRKVKTKIGYDDAAPMDRITLLKAIFALFYTEVIGAILKTCINRAHSPAEKMSNEEVRHGIRILMFLHFYRCTAAAFFDKAYSLFFGPALFCKEYIWNKFKKGISHQVPSSTMYYYKIYIMYSLQIVIYYVIYKLCT